jgi:nitric oxide reductase subunit C
MFMKLHQKHFLLVILSLWLSACGNSAGATNAEALSATLPPVFTQNGCVACHSIEPDGPQQLGPTLAGVAGRAAETIAAPDYTGNVNTVEAYIRESILDPGIHIVAGYTPLMPKTYAASLDEEELAELVDYLLTLE